MTDFRALCEELNGLLEYISDISPHLCEDEINNLTNSARAALAEQPVGPTDEELDDWHQDCIQHCNTGNSSYYWVLDTLDVDMKAVVRAVLARWGES
jgi:hypothetical protein